MNKYIVVEKSLPSYPSWWSCEKWALEIFCYCKSKHSWYFEKEFSNCSTDLQLCVYLFCKQAIQLVARFQYSFSFPECLQQGKF